MMSGKKVYTKELYLAQLYSKDSSFQGTGTNCLNCCIGKLDESSNPSYAYYATEKYDDYHEIWYTFDFSNIPEDAEILEISYKFRYGGLKNTSTYASEWRFQLCSLSKAVYNDYTYNYVNTSRTFYYKSGNLNVNIFGDYVKCNSSDPLAFLIKGKKGGKSSTKTCACGYFCGCRLTIKYAI